MFPFSTLPLPKKNVRKPLVSGVELHNAGWDLTVANHGSRLVHCQSGQCANLFETSWRAASAGFDHGAERTLADFLDVPASSGRVRSAVAVAVQQRPRRSRGQRVSKVVPSVRCVSPGQCVRSKVRRMKPLGTSHVEIGVITARLEGGRGQHNV